MAGTLLAKVGIVGAADCRRQPDAALLVEHRVVIVHLRVPQLLLTPIRRGLQRLFDCGVSRSQRFWGVLIAHRGFEDADRVGLGIEYRQKVGGVFRRAEQRTVGIDGGMAAIRGDEIVEIGLRVGPLPARHHDIALSFLRARWLAVGQLALGDPIRPIPKIPERYPAQFTGERVHHERRRLPRLHAPHPCLFAGFERPERGRKRARG
jgi:hypothetical protein